MSWETLFSSSSSSSSSFLHPFIASLPDDLHLLLCLSFFLAIFSFWLFPGGLAWGTVRTRTAIPGPSGLPVLGLITTFTCTTPHRLLARLAHSFQAKPLMAFSLGFTRFVISSQPDSAKEILNSSAFADRPIKQSAYDLLFHRAMGFAPYGDYWRNLRRISSAHLFSPKRISAFGHFRRKIGDGMVEEIRAIMEKNGEVRVKEVLHFGSLNNVMKSVFGKSYDFSDDEGGGVELEKLVKEGYEVLGMFNWGDHFPVLGWLDLQGVRKRCRSLVGKVKVFVGKIIQEHRAKRRNHVNQDDMISEGDFVDVLLNLEEENKLTDSDMIALLWEMIFRGTDTVAILLEWILARMVLHPDVQHKAQSEIQTLVGKNRSVSDSDLPNLAYLRAIVKETLRMHPPGPLLSWARLAIHDTHIGEYFIPAGTTAMVNMWAITHDKDIWSDPEKFQPERFMRSGDDDDDVAIMGSDLRLAPFGSGRRVCPGKAMGLAMVELWLAQLLQSFHWVPAAAPSGVDLTEDLKLSMEMKHSLTCKAVARA